MNIIDNNGIFVSPSDSSYNISWNDDSYSFNHGKSRLLDSLYQVYY